MLDRLRVAVPGALLLIVLSACGLNAPGVNPTIIVTLPPTNTLAPIVTTTQRFTATPQPTETFIPTITDSPTATFPPITPTNTPTYTPTPPLKGLIKSDAGLVNMRTGPGSSYKVSGQLRQGSPITVIASSEDGKWMLIKLEDGSEGWLSSGFLTLQDPSATAPVLTTPQLTERAQLGTAISLTGTAIGAPTSDGSVPIDSGAPTHVPRIVLSTDVLAYCDKPNVDAVRNKKFTLGSKVVVFWSWQAQTPEQIKDHLNNGLYEVKINGQVIGDWQKYQSPVTQTGKQYIVYWFVPLGQLSAGTYKIDYKLTWKQAIFDGTDHYGPGTDNLAENYTCTFTVK